MKKLNLLNIKKLITTSLCISLLLFSGCGKANTSSENTLEKVKEQGYVTIGFANEKPYAYKTPDGKLTGEAVEVARTVLKNLGVNEIHGELTEFSSLIPGLNAKRFDMITAGMFITPERASQVDFANPEYSIGEGIAVKKGNPLKLHSYKDIAKNTSARVAVPSGTIEYNYLIKSGVPKERIITVSDMPSGLAALQANRVNAITASGPSVQSTVDTAKDSSIERVMDFIQPIIDGKSVRAHGATVFRKDDKEFREAFNKELKKLNDSGELLKIIKPFGFTEQELPGNITTDQLLKEISKSQN